MSFEVNIISTGSKGNCVIIDNEFMLDAGVTKKLVDTTCDLSTLKMMFVSHKHGDHAKLPLIRYCLGLGVSARLVKRSIDEQYLELIGEPQIEFHIPQAVYEMIKDENKFKIDNYLIDIDTYREQFQNIFIHDDLSEFKIDNYKFQLHPQKHHDIDDNGFTL